MLQKILVLSLCAVGAFAAPSDAPRRVCGNQPTTKGGETRLATHQRQPANITGTQVFQNVTIPVHWHVLAGGNSRSQGNISEKQIVDSIDVMNERYNNTGFSFELVNTTRTINPTWFNDIFSGNSVERRAKKALRQGGPETLNIYTASFKNVPRRFEGLLGYATFPSEYSAAPELDGVVIQYETVPGGDLKPFDLGITLVHEAGHWFELYHTFNEGDDENTCDGPGDMVDDTPVQRTASAGCPKNRDSCPNDAGKDPIHNYMDYSNDACMDEFTPGQIARMQSFYSEFRAASVV